MEKTILDTTTWLNFARADAIDTLVAGMAELLAVGQIVEQVELKTWPQGSKLAGTPFSFQPYAAAGVEIAPMTATELASFYQTKVSLRLGDGATEAAVIALSRGWRVATDDGAARKRFQAHNPPISLTGTIGLLRDLIAAKALTRTHAQKILDLARQRGGRLPSGTV